MRLESLNAPVFEPMPTAAMAHVFGGTPTAGYMVDLPGGITFRCASDCTEIDGNGNFYAEFYDAHGCLIRTYTHGN